MNTEQGGEQVEEQWSVFLLVSADRQGLIPLHLGAKVGDP